MSTSAPSLCNRIMVDVIFVIMFARFHTMKNRKEYMKFDLTASSKALSAAKTKTIKRVARPKKHISSADAELDGVPSVLYTDIGDAPIQSSIMDKLNRIEGEDDVFDDDE